MAAPVPALKPPPGVVSNFVDPLSLGYRNNISIGICVPAITILFFLRCYVRAYIKRTWIFEDWLAFTAWAGTVAFCGVGAATMAHNGGKHGWDITMPQAEEASYWFNAASIHYGITICIAKLAVLWLYRRVFSPRRWAPFDMTIVFLIVLLILFYTSTTLVKIWECNPRDKIYNPKLPGTCVDTSMLLNTSGAFNTLTDFLILLLPVKAVWKMNMKTQKKVFVVLVFTFGLCAPVFSLMGFIVRLKGSSNPDKTWVQPEIVMWGTAELTAGVFCVSAPEIGPIFQKRKRGQPSASVINGDYRRNNTHRKWPGAGESTKNHSDKIMSSDSYLELHEGYNYDVDASREIPRGGQGIPGAVNVSKEIRVDSHMV